VEVDGAQKSRGGFSNIGIKRHGIWRHSVRSGFHIVCLWFPKVVTWGVAAYQV